MNLGKERQGHLEDLSGMTLPQLMELLERQEKILSRKKFLATLPDKGEKSRFFAERLKKLIVDSQAREENLVELRLQSHATGVKGYRQPKGEDTVDNRTEAALVTLTSRNEINTTYVDESEEQCISSAHPSNPDDLTKQMEQLSVGTKLLADDSHNFVNSYERVIKKAEQDPCTKTDRFLPNRSKKDQGLMSPSCPNPLQNKTHSTKIKEESAVCPPTYSHKAIQLISIEESVELMQEQKRRTELLAAERAAQRLAEQLSLSTKMDSYQPINTDMRYRQPKEDDKREQDSDDYSSDEDDDPSYEKDQL